MDPHLYGHLFFFFTKAPEQYNNKREVFPTNTAEEMDIHVGKK